MVAREVVEQFGDIQDWRNVTGTGPYQLTDCGGGRARGPLPRTITTGAYDPEVSPTNRLPYADQVEYAIVNDPGGRYCP